MSPLRMLLCEMRALSWLHHTFHWVSSGRNAYQDHLLFMRLYEDVVAEVDSFAEKLVGSFGNDAVEPVSCAFMMMRHLAAMTGGHEDELIPKAADAESRFIRNVERVLRDGELSPGMENFLQGVADKHEEHTYLLQQHMRQVKLANQWGPTGAEE